MNAQTPEFQETLKRMLESPPKENKPLNTGDKSKTGENKSAKG